jgi:SAM-dependent methyltransferase
LGIRFSWKVAHYPPDGRRMTLNRQDLEKISAVTLAHYGARVNEFRRGTEDHDVSQNINELLRHIEGAAPFRILDLGCGPGRDLKAFKALGHAPVGLEGLPEFAAMARAASGCEVLEQDFLKLELPRAAFDGIFANAALFHVPAQELPRVLRELRDALKPRGVLFCSNPHGRNEEGWSRGRYGSFLDWEAWKAFAIGAGFTALDHYYRPAGLPREQQPWLASSWRA